jgi:hypothetical protein
MLLNNFGGGSMDTIQNLKKLLGNYRQNKAILEEKRKIYQSLKEILEEENKKPLDTVEESIEGLSLASPVCSHIPRSVTNKFSSVVENVFLHYENDTVPDRYNQKRILEKMAALQKDMISLIDAITLTENLLNALTDKSRFIIEKIYFEGYTNNETSLLYNEKFRYLLSYRTFRDIKKNIITNMVNILNKMGGSINEV